MAGQVCMYPMDYPQLVPSIFIWYARVPSRGPSTDFHWISPRTAPALGAGEEAEGRAEWGFTG